MSKIAGNYIDETDFRTNSASGDGSTTVFNLVNQPIGTGALWVYVNGIKQDLTTDYSLGGVAVTFVTAPALGQSITFNYIRK